MMISPGMLVYVGYLCVCLASFPDVYSCTVKFCAVEEEG